MRSVPWDAGPAAREQRPRGGRRSFLVLAAAALAAPLALAGCASSGTPSGGSSAAAAPEETGPVEISIFWWGSQPRADITHKVLELYHQKHPNVTFKETWQANAGYYDKLSTLAAGGNAPDIFQIDDNALTEYAVRGVTLDLKPYIGSVIKLDKFPASLRDSGVVNGKVAAIALAENTPAMYYDKTLLDQLGVPAPTVGMSWQELVDWAAQVTQKSNGAVAGTMDPSADYKAFEIWLRQQGKDLYTPDGKFAFTADDLTKWFQFWQDAAAKKATPPADVIHVADGGDVTKQPVVTKKAATSFLWSNQLEALQKATDDELGQVTYPGDPKGQWARASMYFAGAATTKHARTVADVINFFVNDPEAGKILGAERGLAPNLDVRAAIASTLSPANQASSTFESSLAAKFGPTPPVPPKGHSQVKKLLVTAAESVQFKKATPEQAAQTFMTQATAAISG